MAERSAWLHAGGVGAPHGLDGSFYVTRPSPALLCLGARVSIRGAQRVIERRAGTDRRPIIRLSGCNDRAGAEQLRGELLMAARADAPALGPDEWWAEDLVGCAVYDAGREVGVVRRLVAMPSCELLEVKRPDGPDLLVPLVADAVRSVDVGAGRVEVDLGFLGEE